MFENLENFLLLIITIAIVAQILMIIFDAVIAFMIPAYKVQKNLEDPKIIDKLTEMYGGAIFEKIKPKLSEMGNKQVHVIESRLDVKVKNHIKIAERNIQTICKRTIKSALTNDVPHIIEKQLSPYSEKLYHIEKVTDEIRTEIHEEIKETREFVEHHLATLQENIQQVYKALQSDMMRAMSSAGVQGKQQKKAERLMQINELSKLGKYDQMLKLAMGARSMNKISQKEFNDFIDGLSFMEGLKDGSQASQGLSMVWGNTPNTQGSETMLPSLFTQGSPKQEQMETQRFSGSSVNSEVEKEKARHAALEAGWDPKVVDELIRQGEEANKKKVLNNNDNDVDNSQTKEEDKADGKEKRKENETKG